MNERVKTLHELLLSLTKKDKIGLLHHTDPDGVCSGVILGKTIERLRGKKVDVRHNQEGNELSIRDETYKLFKEKELTHVFITDMAVDQEPKNILKLAKKMKVVILDHHKLYNDFLHPNILVIKSSMISKKDPSRYCAAKLVYDLCAGVCDVSDLDWMATVGLIGDMGYPAFMPFVRKVLKKYNIKYPRGPFNTPLGRVATMISRTESIGGHKVKESYKVLYGAKGHREVLSSKLKLYQEKVEKELKKWRGKFGSAEELAKDTLFMLITSKYSIKSNLSTELSMRNKNKTVLLAQKTKKGMLSVSARRQDQKVAVNELLEQTLKSLPKANGGGHIPAAGGTLRPEDVGRFKKNVIKYLAKV